MKGARRDRIEPGSAAERLEGRGVEVPEVGSAVEKWAEAIGVHAHEDLIAVGRRDDELAALRERRAQIFEE